MKKQFDFLVIGSGIAGLFYALKVSKFGKVAIIAKEDISNTTTVKAQGGIASVMHTPDSYDKHIEDTINAGAGLNDREVVEIVVKEGPTRVFDLINIGTHFDKDENGSYELGKEGGHSENRVYTLKTKLDKKYKEH